MKITAKTLKGEVINLDIDPEATILDLKEMIKKEKGLDVETQKIVFKGKATTNTDVLSAIGVKQNDFMVIMTLIKKPEGQKKQQPKGQQKKEENKPAEKPAQTKPVQPTQTKPQQLSQQQEAQITQLMSMGFQRQKCVQALRAAYNNTDRAVQYLINGIPAQGSQGLGQGTGGGLGGPESSQVQNLFRSLLNTPNFAQIKQLIRNDPSTLEPILGQIAQASPQLYALISQHPQAFQKAILQQGEGGSTGNVPRPPPPGAIHITPQQAAAIERLMALGFTKIDAAQAYFACDKNQQLAANLLFDRQANGDLQDEQDLPGGQGGQGGQGGKGGQGGQSGQGQGGQGGDDDDNLFN